MNRNVPFQPARKSVRVHEHEIYYDQLKQRAHLAGDGKIAPRKSKPSSGAAGLQSPPVTYMHICGTEVFSMGVFLLRPGTSMPLHDHPDMNGNLGSC
ncbi:unnamed protein product [Pleuronectes platessa]|uniref:2-aminoethanethiol dioxygenase n=1 Tax=Pleuronectes platessa TaxID=8262 RepID=A0A9N7UGG5_PLEPL|nr:unnamed protein product [Pleuronectes platessa]